MRPPIPARRPATATPNVPDPMPTPHAPGAPKGGAIPVLLSLGSNLEPERHLAAAVAELQACFGPLRVSPAYRTPAVGFDGAPFLNNAVALATAMPLPALEDWLHALEARHGRRRDVPRFSDRTLDVDVVFYGDQVLRDAAGRVRIPRPELKHAFVLKPLADIAPDFVDPLSGRTLAALWREHPQHDEAFEQVSLPLSAPAPRPRAAPAR